MNVKNINMCECKIMTLAEQKQVMLGILSTFAEYCDTHNLRYYLDAGTLIGAVRHKGYIPWDDDIDVNMPQRDYYAFIKQMRKQNGHLSDNIIVEFSDETLYPFLKISDRRTIMIEFPHDNPMQVQVYIDVFPKFGIKDKSWRSKQVCNICYILGLWQWFNVYTLKKWKRPNMELSKRIVGYILDAINIYPHLPQKLQERFMLQYAKYHPLSECKYVTTLTNGEFHKLAPKECFDGFQWLEFEGMKFKGPKDFDTYLHCLYKGDYMQLPPENKRYHHKTEVYWKI